VFAPDLAASDVASSVQVALGAARMPSDPQDQAPPSDEQPAAAPTSAEAVEESAVPETVNAAVLLDPASTGPIESLATNARLPFALRNLAPVDRAVPSIPAGIVTANEAFVTTPPPPPSSTGYLRLAVLGGILAALAGLRVALVRRRRVGSTAS
jgi:hypothetical protein